MKSYTDLKQSKKLAKFLPLESADMRFCFSHTLGGRITGHYPMIGREPSMGTIPCWSLAALFNAVDFNTINLHYDNAIKDWVASATIHDSTKHCTKYESTRALNPVDACVEMIIKLKENKML